MPLGVGRGSVVRTAAGEAKADAMAKFILEARNEHLHGGPYPIASGMFHEGRAEYRFAKPARTSRIPPVDIVTVCRDHLVVLLEIALDAYAQLGVHIDPQQHYTKVELDIENSHIPSGVLLSVGR
jgi:hypothetical protein